jgi:hypothetical protein
MRTGIIVLIIALSVAMVSCSATEFTTPDSTGIAGATNRITAESDRWVWGNWRMHVPADHSSIEVIPVRSADLHYNVKMLLEQAPCDTCIWVSKFVNNGDGTISVDVKIRHPYPGNTYYTGFDVRGIFHTQASYYFPEPNLPGIGHYIPTLETGDPQLLNPDGYTKAYYPSAYPWPPIFKYQPDGDLGGTFEGEEWGWVPPYMPFINYYSSEVRRHFASNAVVTRTYHIALPPGEWDFGYTVDACWAAPTVFPVTDIETDFPKQANTLKCYRLDAFMSGPLVGNSPSTLTVRAYSHLPEILQYFYAIAVRVSLSIEDDVIQHGNPVVVGDEYTEFTCTFANDLSAPSGMYPLLVTGVGLHGVGDDYLDDIENDWERSVSTSQVVWFEVQN